MKISLNHIRHYRDKYDWSGDPAPDGVDALVERIGAQLGAIEEIIDLGTKYQGILIVKVVSCVDHPNADRLHVCKVDDGGKLENVERDENGHVQVICGAPNVHEGMLAAWLPPGSTVPSTVGKDPFVLEVRPIRGEISNGMMASPKELAIGDSHEGILEIDDEVEPGTSFAEFYGLNDHILNIENKMFTHRPDCFGMMGVAREIAGIQHQAFKSPDWYKTNPELPTPEAEELKLDVRNELAELVPRFSAVTMRDIAVKPSPVWLQLYLARVGVRPINNVVDLTNYYMILTGQPLHAYDYDKVKAQDADADYATLVVRTPKDGEKILLLNGKEIEPRREAIMIATRDKLIGVGGVMGGGDTEVDEHTKNIIIECANFDMYSIRRTSMAHGLFTDAVTRFNKGQSPLQNLAVLARIVSDVKDLADGKVASVVIDDDHLPAEVTERGSVHLPVKVAADFINARLGLELSADEMAQLLKNVEFDVQQNGDELVVKAPFWRTDIEIPEDVVEEVGRLYGYDHLPLELPKRDLTPAPIDAMFELKSNIRERLSKAGANEVLTYSFVHGNLLDKVGQDKSYAFQIANALSPDLQYYRLSLSPSLLDKVHSNIKAGYDEFALFEMGKVHSKTELDDGGLPKEFDRIALVFAVGDKTAKQNYGGAAYYQTRKYLADLLSSFGLAGGVAYVPLAEASFEGHALGEQMVSIFEPNRSAVIKQDDRIVGVVGEYRKTVQRALKLPAYSAGFEIFMSVFDGGLVRDEYSPLPRFPKIEQDICLKVVASMSYQQLFGFVQQQISEYQLGNVSSHISPIDIYQREDDREHKQITLRLSIASYERTRTDTEVTKLLDQVAEAAKEKFSAERI